MNNNIDTDLSKLGENPYHNFWRIHRKHMFESLGIWEGWTLLAQAYHKSMFE